MAAMWRGALVAAALGLAAGQVGERQPVEIRGVPGEVSVVNGVYYPTPVLYGGQPCYHKVMGTDMWLCTDSNGYWNAQPVNQRGTSNGYMISSGRHQALPEQAGPWSLWQKGEWKAFPQITSTAHAPASAAPTLAPGQSPIGQPVDESLAPWQDAIKPKEGEKPEGEASEMTWAISMMLFGTMGTAMVILSLVNGTDPHIRSYIYKMVSMTMCIFLCVLVTQALQSLLFKQLIAGKPPLGFGIGSPVGPVLKIVVNVCLFLGLHFAFVFIGWKVQYSRQRLLTLRTLFAHVIGFTGLYMFQDLLVAAVQAAGDGSRPSLLGQLPTAIFTAVLAWVLLAMLRQVTMVIAKRRLTDPSADSWPPPMRFAPVTSEDKPNRLQCFGGASPGGTPARPTDAERSQEPNDWYGHVSEAEDEVAVCVVAFLITQAAVFAFTGQLPGLHDRFIYGQSTIDRWWMAIGVAIVVHVAIFYLRAGLGDKSRQGSILQRTGMMVVSWCFYRLTDWQTRLYFAHDLSLATVVAAFATTVLSVAMTLILDRVADIAERSIPKNRELARSEPADDPIHGRALRSIILCFGFLVGISWEKAFDVALESIVVSTDLLRDHEVISHGLLSIFVAVLVVRPWRRYIMPKAEMTPSDHEEAIEMELRQMDRVEGILLDGA